MEFIKLKCPQCDADLEIENGIDLFYCKYCGCRLMLDGQNKYVVAAKVRQKELEHERYKMNFAAQEKEKDYKREKESNKNLLVGFICILRCPAAVVAVLNSRWAVSNRPICGGERSVNCYAVLSQRYSVL